MCAIFVFTYQFKKINLGPGVVAPARNPSYLEPEIGKLRFKASSGKKLVRPSPPISINGQV
jgi:hypothetical protein